MYNHAQANSPVARMKRITASVSFLLVALLLAGAPAAHAGSNYTKAQKQAQKDWKKYTRQQQKAYKKQLKAQSKAAKKYNKQHATRSVT
jgi:hypothetical protein